MKNIGKKPHRFTFTYEDISNVTGLSVETLYVYVSKGVLDPEKLSSVVRFVRNYLPVPDKQVPSVRK